MVLVQKISIAIFRLLSLQILLEDSIQKQKFRWQCFCGGVQNVSN